MNAAIVRKSLREALLPLSVVVLGVLIFEMIFIHAIGTYAEEILGMWARRPALKRIVQVLVGSEFGDQISATAFASLGLVHPVMLTLSWAFVLASVSRGIAGEVERGTADLLFTLPISRVRLYLSLTGVWLLTTALIAVTPWVGIWNGLRISPMWEPVDVRLLGIAAVNYYALLLALASATLCLSAFHPRRGVTIAILIGILVASFLVNFLEPFWNPAREQLRFLGILNYYRPFIIVRDEAWPVWNLAALLGSAVVLWCVGLWRFCTRDIPAA
jgi:ABC-2 type transport system permease protein